MITPTRRRPCLFLIAALLLSPGRTAVSDFATRVPGPTTRPPALGAAVRSRDSGLRLGMRGANAVARVPLTTDGGRFDRSASRVSSPRMAVNFRALSCSAISCQPESRELELIADS